MLYAYSENGQAQGGAMMSDCEFCREFAGDSDARFYSQYPGLKNRIVQETGEFLAVPTLGQLFPGSLLVLPRHHVHACAMLSAPLRKRLCDFVESVMHRCERFGHPIFFEHGAAPHTGGSCGIYHAHIHIVPLPTKTSLEELFDYPNSRTSALEHALSRLSSVEHYLLIGDNDRTFYADMTHVQPAPPSQYFRQQLAKTYRTRLHWDWRAAPAYEKDLVDTIQALA